jgi:hypothetical protein
MRALLAFVLALPLLQYAVDPQLPIRVCWAAPAVQQAAATQAPPAQAAPAKGESSKNWIGRYSEFEEFLKTAPIQRFEDVGVGVTHPRRGFFAPGGVAGSAIIKKVDEPVTAPRLDCFRAEIAAYELDKMLQLDMIPPTVERRIDGDRQSVQLWMDNSRTFRKAENEPKPDVEAWNRDVFRMKVFDNLIVNIDRNAGNMLLDSAWHLILIDHSRAFDGRIERMVFPPEQMSRIDRPFFEKLKALEKNSLKERVGPWVRFGVDPILRQRDKIIKHYEKLIAAQGEEKVLTK